MLNCSKKHAGLVARVVEMVPYCSSVKAQVAAGAVASVAAAGVGTGVAGFSARNFASVSSSFFASAAFIWSSVM
jgi:hypothetical protein